MRFDEFLAQNGIAAFPVDRFDGFTVDVGVAPDWEPFDSAVGIGVWVCRSDPYSDKFCANAVLTLHHVDDSLDAGDVFAMLSEQQVRLIPGCRELNRELAAATEGAGIAGILTMQINHQLGTIDSISRSRIITTERATLIAQLTLTVLHDSPVDRENIWLSVRLGATSRPIANKGGVPVSRMQEHP